MRDCAAAIAAVVTIAGIIAAGETASGATQSRQIAPGGARSGAATSATFTCTASAGLTKGDAARLTGDVQRTGGYKITVSADGMQVLVSADPEEPKRSGNVTRVAAPIDTVLLRSPYKSEAIAQPAKVERQPVQSKNATPAGADANRAVASFDRKAVQALPAGDVLVIVNTADGERICRISAKNRRRIAG
jgi:hypothetical protein